MANVIERSFKLAFSSQDELETIIPAIRRRIVEVEKFFWISGPFFLRVPRTWSARLVEEYVTTGITLFEKILEERISGIEFLEHLSNGDPEFSLVWRLPDIRRRI